MTSGSEVRVQSVTRFIGFLAVRMRRIWLDNVWRRDNTDVKHLQVRVRINFSTTGLPSGEGLAREPQSATFARATHDGQLARFAGPEEPEKHL